MPPASTRDRLIRLLMKPDAYIEPEGEAYVVRCHQDRRRKPLLSLARAEAVEALKGLALRPRPQGGFQLKPGDASQSHDVQTSWQTDTDGLNVRRQVNAAESPMAWLMRHKDQHGLRFLTRAHLAALEKLRDDHLTGYAQPGLTSNWEAFGGGGRSGLKGDDPHLFRLAARRRCEAALACLDGDLRILFERVCLEGTALGVIERGFSLPRRSAKHHVRAALDRLAHHYGH